MPNLSEDIRSELEREVALAQREAELTRREGALARAEAERAVVADEGLAAREQELAERERAVAQAAEAVEGQRRRLIEVREEYEERRRVPAPRARATGAAQRTG